MNWLALETIQAKESEGIDHKGNRPHTQEKVWRQCNPIIAMPCVGLLYPDL